jgi:hypothetical protein
VITSARPVWLDFSISLHSAGASRLCLEHRLREPVPASRAAAGGAMSDGRLRRLVLYRSKPCARPITPDNHITGRLSLASAVRWAIDRLLDVSAGVSVDLQSDGDLDD